MADTAAEAWRLFMEAFMTNRPRFLRIGAEFDLHPMQFHTLKLLEPGMELSQRELSERLLCDASNVTGIVDRLEARGLIERRPAAQDRRVKLLALTPQGELLRERVLERMLEPPPAVRALPREKQRALRDLMAEVLAGLREDAPAEAPEAPPVARSAAG